jgi:hypothetical protein
MTWVYHWNLANYFDGKSECSVGCARFEVFTSVLLEESGLLGCDTVLLSYCFHFFKVNIVPLSSRVQGLYASTTEDQGILIW